MLWDRVLLEGNRRETLRVGWIVTKTMTRKVSWGKSMEKTLRRTLRNSEGSCGLGSGML